LKLFAMLFLLFPLFSAQAQTQLYFEETQALTRAVPSGNPALLGPSAARPLPLKGYSSYRITVCPETGYALTGSDGSKIRLYVYNPSLGKWGYRKELDQNITITGNQVNICQTFGLRVDVPYGYLHPTTISVGVTGGTTVTVQAYPGNL
jgi:hypothetical protein